MLQGLGRSAVAMSTSLALLCLANPAFAQRDAAAVPRAPTPGQSWTYGRHPILGVSAYVQTSAGGFAIGCNLSSEYGGSLVFRIEDSLDPAPGRRDKLVIVEGGRTPLLLDGEGTHVLKDPVKFPYYGAGYGDFVATKRGYIEKYANAVDVPFEQLRHGRAVYLARGSVDDELEDTLVVNQDGNSKVLISNDDLTKLKYKTRISLNNSNKALNQLMANCPGIAEQLDYDLD